MREVSLCMSKKKYFSTPHSGVLQRVGHEGGGGATAGSWRLHPIVKKPQNDPRCLFISPQQTSVALNTYIFI